MNENGTSAATAHVTGVAALLMSYVNPEDPSIKNRHHLNLAPEDIEYILQMTATPTDPAGFNIYTGYGRVNAGAALQAIDSSHRKIKHFSTKVTGELNRTVTQISQNDTIVLDVSYKNDDDKRFARGTYVVKTYEISTTVQHNLSQSDSIVAYWPLHNTSEVLGLIDTNWIRHIVHRVSISNLNKTTATLKGYAYEVVPLSSTGNNGWWPEDPTVHNLDMAYSILVDNPNMLSDKPEMVKNDVFTIYPNPAYNLQYLEWQLKDNCTVEVSLHDLQGRKLKDVFQGKMGKGKDIIEVDVSRLPVGLYFYKVVYKNKQSHIKTLVQ